MANRYSQLPLSVVEKYYPESPYLDELRAQQNFPFQNTGIMQTFPSQTFNYDYIQQDPYRFTGFNEDVLDEEEDAQYNLPEKLSIFSNILDSGEGILQNLKDYLPFIGDKSITGMLTSGIGQFFNKIGDRISSTPQYQRYTPGYNYGNLNPNLIDDFYDPATGLNRFDRAKTLFGQSRTLSEYLSKRRERAVESAVQAASPSGSGGDTFNFSDSSGYGGTGTSSPSNVGPGGRMGGGV